MREQRAPQRLLPLMCHTTVDRPPAYPARPGPWLAVAAGLGLLIAWPAQSQQPASPQNPRLRHPLLSCNFTNELGQPVRLSDFDGQALAITFFFTRCPIPDYCPRLSKNFQEASKKLSQAAPPGPTNWHFLSVTFDPQFDAPPVLKAYAQRYRADPAHWNFLTGSPEKSASLPNCAG